jgi:hypothetical protein
VARGVGAILLKDRDTSMDVTSTAMDAGMVARGADGAPVQSYASWRMRGATWRG